MDNDSNPNKEMVEDLGIDPPASVDDRQRFDLLRKWHREDAQRETEEKDDPSKR